MQGRSGRSRWIALVPNALSVGRIGLAAVFPFLEGYWRAGLIIIVALSDGLDGLIARRFDAATWVGGLLDSIADKVFVAIVLATYLVGTELRWWEVVLLLSRDLSVLAIAAYLAGMRLWSGFRQMPARLPGKATTAAMFVLIVLLAIWSDARPPAVHAVLLLTIALSVLAGGHYLSIFVRAEIGRRRGQPMETVHSEV